MNDWAQAHFSALRAVITDRDDAYPCHFGVHSEHKGDNHYTALAEPGAVAGLADELRDFIDLSRRLRRGRRATLLCGVGPPGATESLEQDRELFWRVLAELRELDQSPCPPNVPADPADPAWTFSFHGERMFVFGLSPFYGRRASRRIGDCLTVCFQSDRVFADISGATPAGISAKATIRARLAEYDDVPLIAALGDGKSSTDGKWRQFFPREDGSIEVGRCPLAGGDAHV